MSALADRWLIVVVGVLSGCVGCRETHRPTPIVDANVGGAADVVPSAPPSASSVAPLPAPAPRIEIRIASVRNTMTFDRTKLTVPAGSEVHLVLKNNAPKGRMQHNWVLLARSGIEASIAEAGQRAGRSRGWVPADPDVLAHTPMSLPGSVAEVTFMAPPAGQYPYICTFQGHYLTMKGVLTVTP